MRGWVWDSETRPRPAPPRCHPYQAVNYNYFGPRLQEKKALNNSKDVRIYIGLDPLRAQFLHRIKN